MSISGYLAPPGSHQSSPPPPAMYKCCCSYSRSHPRPYGFFLGCKRYFLLSLLERNSNKHISSSLLLLVVIGTSVVFCKILFIFRYRRETRGKQDALTRPTGPEWETLLTLRLRDSPAKSCFFLMVVTIKKLSQRRLEPLRALRSSRLLGYAS